MDQGQGTLLIKATGEDGVEEKRLKGFPINQDRMMIILFLRDCARMVRLPSGCSKKLAGKCPSTTK